ncbi:MAG: AAA family ATPase, partial [Limnothrix sp. RL_2_0]|nr:AAA family ATPase [Limnothrix sp. RL_2_0]
ALPRPAQKKRVSVTRNSESFEDCRTKKQGVPQWHFKLRLWSKDIEPNIQAYWEAVKTAQYASEPPLPQSSVSIPGEFQSLVNYKSQDFVGRGFVFKEIQTFLQTQPNGYLVLQADPGAGKSSILAELLAKKYSSIKVQSQNETDNAPSICTYLSYFNNQNQGINKVDQFLRSMRSQLCQQYSLFSSTPTDRGTIEEFPDLLQQASDQLSPNEKLIIVIDALDEIDLSTQPSGSNIFYLPDYLPDNVYFILTQRRLSDLKLPYINRRTLDLSKYPTENHADIKTYIHFITQRPHFIEWRKKQNLTDDQFLETLAIKSEDNFMYLHCVFHDIKKWSLFITTRTPSRSTGILCSPLGTNGHEQRPPTQK